MKVIGLSGSQGAGKSTLLTELTARGWDLDQFRVSRAVQAALGWASLDRVMDAPDTMMAFQEEVFAQKQKNDAALKADPSDKIILTERTFADIFAYTTRWTWKFVDDGRMTMDAALQFLLPYTNKCKTAQHEIYAGTLLLPLMEHVVWENDPNRAKFEDAALIFEDIENFFERKLAVVHRRKTITGITVAERADQAEYFLNGF